MILLWIVARHLSNNSAGLGPATRRRQLAFPFAEKNNRKRGYRIIDKQALTGPSPRVSQDHARRHDLYTPASRFLVDVHFDLRHLLLKTPRKRSASRLGPPEVTLCRRDQFAIVLPERLKPPSRNRFERLTSFAVAITE